MLPTWLAPKIRWIFAVLLLPLILSDEFILNTPYIALYLGCVLVFYLVFHLFLHNIKWWNGETVVKTVCECSTLQTHQLLQNLSGTTYHLTYELLLSFALSSVSLVVVGYLANDNLWMLPTWLAPDILISVWIFFGVVLFIFISDKRFWTKRIRLLSQITTTRDQIIHTAQQGIVP